MFRQGNSIPNSISASNNNPVNQPAPPLSTQTRIQKSAGLPPQTSTNLPHTQLPQSTARVVPSQQFQTFSNTPVSQQIRTPATTTSSHQTQTRTQAQTQIPRLNTNLPPQAPIVTYPQTSTQPRIQPTTQSSYQPQVPQTEPKSQSQPDQMTTGQSERAAKEMEAFGDQESGSARTHYQRLLFKYLPNKLKYHVKRIHAAVFASLFKVKSKKKSNEVEHEREQIKQDL